MFTNEFDYDRLCLEYKWWIQDFSNGKSPNGLRFGQYLVNKYLNTDCQYPELFSAEKASDAFEIAQKYFIGDLNSD